MSGTSLDGVDAVIADFAPESAEPASCSAPRTAFSDPRCAPSCSRCSSRADELARAARAANALADLYARSDCRGGRDARASRPTTSSPPASTARRCAIVPTRAGRCSSTIRRASPSSRGMTVVADFRSRDVAAGGQGAPLVPAFHAALFGGDVHRVVVNLGGIANLTDLAARRGRARLRHRPRQRAAGPLARAAPRRRRSTATARGRATGSIDAALLAALLDGALFRAPPPKSTGRDLFNRGLARREQLAGRVPAAPPDVQATLVALTARTIADAIRAALRRARPRCSSAAAARTTRR